jgi:hypothetical protein
LPIVGWAMFIGYLVDVLESIRQQSDKNYPTFDIDRIGHYLSRGIMPVLAHLAALLPVVLLFAGALGALLLTGGPQTGPSTAGKLVAACLFVLIVLAGLVASLVVAPLTLYLALGDPNGEGMGRFVTAFFKHVRNEAVLAQVFVVVTGLALGAFGFLMCGIGAPPALALAGFAQYHLLGQLYDLYQQRRTAAEPVPSNA